ncbi:hypothetical protein NFJ02_03g100760 [Pycnococcus provasolii]
MTDSSQEVDFPFFGSGEIPNLAEVRFANWVTGPAGEFRFADFGGQSSLTSIYAPRLEGNSTLSVEIGGNPNLAEVDLSALKEAENVVISGNRELVDVKLPELTTVANFLVIIGNENLVGISIPVLTTSSNEFQVYGNSNLQTLCAPNLEDGGSVCIGNESDQQSLDADLSSLVTGTFAGFSTGICYGGTDPPTNQLNATKVCGKEVNGLFSDIGCPSAGCPETP